MAAVVGAPRTFKYHHLEVPGDDKVACRRRAKDPAKVQEHAAGTIQCAYRNYRMRLQRPVQRSGTVGELAQWNFQTVRFLYYPSSSVKDPSMYLAMTGEVFSLLSLICFVITWVFHREVFSSNPLLSALGYNNICVVFDTSPAREVAAIMWAAIIYCNVEYARTLVDRINRGLKYCPSWKRMFMKVSHSVCAVTSATFLLCFLIPPTKSLTWHTRPFAAYMIFKYLSLFCTVWEARLVGNAKSLARITWATWVFMAFYGFLSLIFLPVTVELSYHYHATDRTRAPLLNPYIFGTADWSWFICSCVCANFLPKPALLVDKQVFQRETMESLQSIFDANTMTSWACCALQSSGCCALLRRLSCCRRRPSSIADLHLRAAEREDLSTTGAAHITELSDMFASMSCEVATKDPTCTSDPRTGFTISVMKASLTIDERVEQLAPWHRCGLFASPGKYNGFVRINVTEHGAARLSIRLDVPSIMEVLDECDRGDGRPGVRQVDLLLAEGLEQFAVPSPDALLHLLQVVHSPSLCSLLHIPALWRAVRGFQRALRGLDNTKGVSGKTFYSGLPFKLGSGACKFAVTPKRDHKLSKNEVPCSFPGASMTGSEEEVAEKYAVAMVNQLSDASSVMEWDFRVQVAKCERSHNLSEGDSAWNAAVSPYMAVGSLCVYPEPWHATEVADQKCPPLYFNPWNMLKAHEPLGALNHARMFVYREHQKVRQRAGGGKQPDRVCPFLAQA